MAKWYTFIKSSKCYPFIKGLVIFGPISYYYLIHHISRVDGCSMQPCLNPDRTTCDWVYTKEASLYDIHRGDVVTLISPTDPEEHLIKRVIALPGDVILKVHRPELVKIPEGHCWVEGDHTKSSKDSNMFGPVSLSLIKSKAFYVIWPPSRWQQIPCDIPPGREPISKSLSCA